MSTVTSLPRRRHATSPAPHAPSPRDTAPPPIETRAERAECTCPDPCERDHERD